MIVSTMSLYMPDWKDYRTYFAYRISVVSDLYRVSLMSWRLDRCV